MGSHPRTGDGAASPDTGIQLTTPTDPTAVVQVDPLSHLTPSQQAIIRSQLRHGGGGGGSGQNVEDDAKAPPEAGYLDLYRFATRTEILLNILGLVAGIAAGCAQPLLILVFGNIITQFTAFSYALALDGEGQDLATARSTLLNSVNQGALYMVYIGIGMLAASYFYMAVWIVNGETLTRRIRQAYLKSALRQNVGYWDDLGAGEVTTKLTYDMNVLQRGVSEKVPMVTQYTAQFFAGFVVAFIKDWRLALVLSTIVPAILITGWAFTHYDTKYRERMMAHISKGGTLAEESITSVRTVHAYDLFGRLGALYARLNDEALRNGKKSAYVNAIGIGVFYFFLYGAYACAFFYGTKLVLQGRATSGDVVAAMEAVVIGALSVAQIAPNLQAISSAAAAASSIFRTIRRVPPIDTYSEEGRTLPQVRGEIVLEHVEFFYPSRPTVKVLHDFTATFPAGKITALVGASGSGKSSIIGLLERFYDILGGRILLDGIDISTLNVRWLRSQIGLVGQEPTLFSGTIFDNVAHGLIDTRWESEDYATRLERIKDACKVANAHDFIQALSEGYSTEIGERAALLSGGQKQRIAIARAIVGDPPILLLDEATSALDVTSERLVQEALDQASHGRTVITIAHRLSTIKDAHQIIVMDRGRIVERGDHRSLLEQSGGVYAGLVRAQAVQQAQTTQLKELEKQNSQDTIGVQGEEHKEEHTIDLVRKPTRLPSQGSVQSSRKMESTARATARRGDTALSTSPRLAKHLLGEVGEMKTSYLLGTVSSIIVGMVYPIVAILFGALLATFSDPDESTWQSTNNRLAGLMFAVTCIATLTVVIQALSLGIASERVSASLRQRIYKTTLAKRISFFDDKKNSAGALTSNISALPQKIGIMYGMTLGTIIGSVTTLVGGLAVGISYSWRIGLVGLACAPLTICAGFVRVKVVNMKDEKTGDAHERAAQRANEAASAIRTVVSLSKERQVMSEFGRSLSKASKVAVRIALVSNVLFSITQSLIFFVVALVFWYGSRLLVDQKVSPGAFMVALTAVIFGAAEAGNAFTWVPDLSGARGAAITAFTLLEKPQASDGTRESTEQTSMPEKANGKGISQGHIVLKNVHFRYPTRPDIPVLRGLDLEVRPGQFVALVGPSGCGKSTIIQLLQRFYDEYRGQIVFDGQDARAIDVKLLRQRIALVSQEPTLYDGTILFNVKLGSLDEDVSQADVEQAAREANIHDFIMSLPDGYETEVGGRGVQLSGGQKQRVCIARALIRNPKVLLLDEATSALDSQSEQVVQAALDAAAMGRSTIAIAHRLSTIQKADIICVLREGKVAEKGTHQELLEKGGLYYELVEKQRLDG